MSKVKVIMRDASWNLEAGQEVEVEKETAEQLVADGHAVRASDASAETRQAAKKKGE